MESAVVNTADMDSTSPSLLQDITLEKSDMVMRNSSSGLTMKEYEEQLKKLTAENFNLKLRIYFVEERLSKVKGISDKEELVKKIIELQVACEAKSKELESKQELIYEASKALDTLQTEHEEQLKKLRKEKEKEIAELTNKIESLEQSLKEVQERNFPEVNPAEYEKQIAILENQLSFESERVKELQDLLNENNSELESYQIKIEKLEVESDMRLQRLEEERDRSEKSDQALQSANFQLRKYEDELLSKQREEEILKERLEEKTKTIDSLKASLATRDTSITLLEAKHAKERSSFHSIQAKFDSMNFQNNRLKAEVEMLHSRLKRCNEMSKGGRKSPQEEFFKQKYEEFARAVEEREEEYRRRITELEDKYLEKETELNDCKQQCLKNKKLEDDHRKACAALRNFIKRSTEEKKEREHLKAMLSTKEIELRELQAQLEMNSNKSIPRDLVSVDNKLKMAKTGEKESGKMSAEDESYSCCKEKDRQLAVMLTNLEKKDAIIEEYKERALSCNCGSKENVEKIHELEGEIIVLKCQLDDKDNEAKEGSRRFDVENKDIEKFNGELNKRNQNFQELINKELWDKNRQIETLEKRLNVLTEEKELEVLALNQQVLLRDQELNVLREQFADLGVSEPLSTIGDGDAVPDTSGKLKSLLLETCKEKRYLVKKVEELNERLKHAPERDSESKTIHSLKLECGKAREDAIKAEAFRREAAEMCTLLTLRLEELAGFLDSLLANREMLSGINPKRRQDIKQAVERSRELSRHLTLSLIGKSCDEGTLVLHPNDESFADLLTTNLSAINKTVDSLGASVYRDKIIAEQSAIILRLQDQLRLLNDEAKDGEMDEFASFSDSDKPSSGKLVNVSTQFSEVGDDVRQRPDSAECARHEKCPKTVVLMDVKRRGSTHGQDASESEAWSEPDRSVSQARMGHIEDVMHSLSIRGSKMDDSTEESSEETINEKSRSSGKRNAESEIRRLQVRIKTLDENNEELRKELNALKNGQGDAPFVTKYQKFQNDDANLIEKLNKTVNQLEESRMACRDLEYKLSEALERASASATHLKIANETIGLLEEDVKNLREELKNKSLESNQKSEMIEDLRLKMEERVLESELRLAEAIKQKEAAEQKTLEVECRLKDAENMSKEVESRVVEIEKKINETKKFKRETVMQFKEAERNVDTAEKIMEEAEKMKLDAERKSRDFQNYVDLMRKDVEERVKEAERRVKKAEKERDEMEKHMSKMKKKLIEAEENKNEVETKVKEGKETIQCMEEKLKELEVAMDQCNKEAQRRIKEMQKKADAKMAELEHQMQEREWVRKSEVEKKMMEAEKISRELEIGFKSRLEDAEKRIRESKNAADFTVKKIEEEYKKRETDLQQRIINLEKERDTAIADYRKQLEKLRLEASELELELTRITNEKIRLEEDIKLLLDKENALEEDNREIRGRYESSIHELEAKLSKLTLNKSELADRLEEIESTNIDLASRISAIRGKDVMDRDFEGSSPPSSPIIPQSILTNLLTDVEFGTQEVNGNQFVRHRDQLVLGVQSIEAFAPPRRNMNSSPDLGIESDPGRFSSLEAQHQNNADPISGNREDSEVKRLEAENAELRRRLVKTRQTLEETLTQLSAANQRKKQVERAICKQLHKTHHVLKRARVNLEGQDPDHAE